MRLLVTGGAGYVGSHMVKALLRAGHSVLTLDDFSTGRRPELPGEILVRGSIADAPLLDAIFGEAPFDAVLHFAARSIVSESTRDPAAYWASNVGGTLVLLEAMRRRGVLRLVFSSSAAVYGDCGARPIPEDALRRPVNAYGKTKLAVEHALEDWETAYGVRSVRLRYFNAAGADEEGELCERHQPETHLIPLALQAAAGERGPLPLYGEDYPTQDGTCVRDYVHVSDLCDAHLLALARLQSGQSGAAYNLGNSRGYSVREVLHAVESVTGMRVPVRKGGRRPGDPAVLVADSARARRQLGWRPRHEALGAMIESAWRAMAGHVTPRASAVLSPH